MWKKQILRNVFGYFYVYFCEIAVNGWKSHSHFLNADEIAINCYRQIQIIPIRTLIYDMQCKKEKEELFGTDPAEQYNYYNEKLLSQEIYIKALAEEFPELF